MIRLKIDIMKVLEILDLDTDIDKLISYDRNGYMFEITINEPDVICGDNHIYLVKNNNSLDAFYNVYISKEEQKHLIIECVEIEEL
ncbi:MAG: hypothetical protein N2749_01055 [Clostridia bacterium]|nr:hypothetical protein [Clostridia bacterium]